MIKKFKFLGYGALDWILLLSGLISGVVVGIIFDSPWFVIMLPMYIYGAIHWITHRDKQENLVIVRKNLSKKEWSFMGVGFVVVSIGVYFLLKALNTAELVISTLSFITILTAVYLLIRRCMWNQVAFLVNDFVVPILWILLIVHGELILLPMIINFVFQIIYDSYGLIEWIKIEKKQKQKGKNE